MRMPHLSSMPFHISDAWKSGERIVDSAIRLLPNVVLGIIVFVIFLFLGTFTKWFVRRAAERRNSSRVGLALLLGRLGQLGMVVLGILIAFAIAAPSFNAGGIIKMLGVGSVAICLSEYPAKLPRGHFDPDSPALSPRRHDQRERHGRDRRRHSGSRNSHPDQGGEPGIHPERNGLYEPCHGGSCLEET